MATQAEFHLRSAPAPAATRSAMAAASLGSMPRETRALKALGREIESETRQQHTTADQEPE